MIYPSNRSVLLIALGAPIAAVIGAIAPSAWAVGIAWSGMLIILTLLDGLLAGRARDIVLSVADTAEVGAETGFGLTAQFKGTKPRTVYAQSAVGSRLSSDGRAAFELHRQDDGEYWSGRATLTPTRRGNAEIERFWLRWYGPLSLAWRQVSKAAEKNIAVLPNIAAIRSPSVQLFMRDAMFGLLAQRFRGDGSEFESLREYHPGMDRRSIDWKGSARHSKLLAKEYDTERNNQIVFALDCGSSMCEPIDGLPRIDRAVSAALMTSYVALKSGDRTSLFSFAAKPRTATPFFTGTRNFHRMQMEAAEIDYLPQESNFTLALSTLATRLQRRSLIIVFTDFTDPTSAELMVEAVGRLISRHMVLFVVMEDNELTRMRDAPPATSDTIAEAVTADALLEQKRLVITKLKHIGVDVIEAPHQDVGTQLINNYLRIKRRGQL